LWQTHCKDYCLHLIAGNFKNLNFTDPLEMFISYMRKETHRTEMTLKEVAQIQVMHQLAIFEVIT